MTLYRAVRAVAGPILRVVWRLEVVGAENMPTGAAIVVANHDSLSDPFFLGAALDRQLHFLAKRELWSNRVVGRVLDGLGGIPVERRRGDLTAVAIFPQGTVLGDDERPWQRGAARLALTTGAPLVPVAIAGAADVLRPRTRIPRLARVRVVVGEPIAVAVAPPTIPAGRELTVRIRDAVAALAEG